MNKVTLHQTAGARAATLVVIVAWFGAAAYAGFLGLVDEPERPPLVLASFIAVPILTFLAGYALSNSFRAFTSELCFPLLVGSHVWRLVGIGFVYGWLTGRLAAGVCAARWHRRHHRRGRIRCAAPRLAARDAATRMAPHLEHHRHRRFDCCARSRRSFFE